MDPSPTTRPPPLPPPTASPSASSPSFPFPITTDDDDDTVRRPPLRATPAGARTDMSRPVGRVGSDLSHSNYSTATNHGALHHQSTSKSNNDSISANKARQRLSLLFSGVGTWRRSESGGTAGRAQSSSKKRQVKGSSQRGGLEIWQLMKKYMSMVEQLFTSFSGGRERERRELRRRPHSFTSGRGWNGPSKRHKGRLSSAPASLGGSPANSGHLSVGGSVTKVSTSSDESTMEELQSAIQAAIAHCKNSIAVAKQAGGDKCAC